MTSREDTTVRYLDYSSYDHVVVAFSGGKDSLACVLHLLDTGCPKDKIELWHHDVDGREGSTLMDWPVTRDYCRKVAAALDLPLYFSWKVGGFEREMLRHQSKTAPIMFETPEGTKQVGGTRSRTRTEPCPVCGELECQGCRGKFPQVSADLSVRWCSAYLKVDVGARAISNQERFNHSRTLFVTGERAQESAARAKYLTFEPDRADRRDSKRLQRHVDHWRPVHGWNERDVWDIIKRHGVRPHPAYLMGWGRLSCASCIFGSRDQWASLAKVDPDRVQRIEDYEREFGKTIKRKESVEQQVAAGKVYDAVTDERAAQAMSKSYTESVIMESWQLPAGAFGDNAGPC